MNLELTPHDMAHGGEAVARSDGKTYFVPDAIPGETVTAEVVLDKGNWARTSLLKVVDPSADRVDAPCPHFEKCGGCQWQHMSIDAQLSWKQSIVEGQLKHLGKLEDPEVRTIRSPGPAFGYRNRMDFRVQNGKPAMHVGKSHDLVELDECTLMHPALQEVFGKLGDLSGVDRIIMRTSATRGDSLLLVTGELPSQYKEWGTAVALQDGNKLEPVVGDPWLFEDIDGCDLRIHGTSFFQNNTEGAMALVEEVKKAAQLTDSDVLLDAFAGGGLFAVTLGREVDNTMAIEMAGNSVIDLRYNLGQNDVFSQVIQGPFKEVIEMVNEPWSVAIVDPPRTGLGENGVAAVTATRPRKIVYVSCDPASLSRDVRYMAGHGYQFQWARPVDLFPQTFHIETVALFEPGLEDDDEAE